MVACKPAHKLSRSKCLLAIKNLLESRKQVFQKKRQQVCQQAQKLKVLPTPLKSLSSPSKRIQKLMPSLNSNRLTKIMSLSSTEECRAMARRSSFNLQSKTSLQTKFTVQSLNSASTRRTPHWSLQLLKRLRLPSSIQLQNWSNFTSRISQDNLPLHLWMLQKSKFPYCQLAA